MKQIVFLRDREIIDLTLFFALGDRYMSRMRNIGREVASFLAAAAFVIASIGAAVYWFCEIDIYPRGWAEYQNPAEDAEETFRDDQLEDKHPPPFDASLVDRRTVGPYGEWRLNASAAVIRLDVPRLLPDREANLLTLHKSYTAAIVDGPQGESYLPSVNLVAGKAKQFDDGLRAALDQACYQGIEGKFPGYVQLVHRLYDRAGKAHVAAPYLAAGLELAGVQVEVANREAKAKFLDDFRANEIVSKPVSFYTWNPDLVVCFRFLRFFSREFASDDLAMPLADVLARDEALLADYRKAIAFRAKLTNKQACLSMADLVGKGSLQTPAFIALAREKGVPHVSVALFPAPSLQDGVLFERLFPAGLPPGTNLMRELVRRIRSGEVDLRPGPESGWNDYQIYALETMLLPEKGEEKDKLLLTKTYKKRMFEAFAAILTIHRDTESSTVASALPDPLSEVRPRLRVEPCPSYFLRTARAYAFLTKFLESALGPETLQSLHGLKEGGRRSENLYAELQFMRDLFYGLYLVSADDIGLKPNLGSDEPVDRDRCYTLAADWLHRAFGEEDAQVDARIPAAILVDPQRRVTRLWLTLGIRLSKLEASYVTPPHVKPAQGGNWEPVEGHRLQPSEYLLPVEEFAEVEIPGLRVLTREELRAICDREQTKDAILRALQRQ